MDEKELIKEIQKAASEAGKIMLEASDPKVMEKSGHANFCTETDEKIQEYLVERLQGILPEAAFLGEEEGQDEFTEKMKKGFVFVIDPIDGTSNFIYAYRPSVVSIALLKDKKPYMAVIYNPFDDMMFSAVSGQGAYMNGERIMSSDAPLSESLAVFGTAPYYTELRDRTFEIAKALMPHCVDIRRSGTAAWDMCCVAMGRCSLYFELRIQVWDYAAAALIATEAGCTVTDIDGNPLSYEGASSALCLARGVKETGADLWTH
jgi:myo-inositol-1(or 4)-monophosphatase